MSRWANTSAHAHCQHVSGIPWFLARIETTLYLTTPKRAILDYEILKNFRHVSDLYFLSNLVECSMYPAYWLSENKWFVWSMSISISSEWPPTGSRHRWRGYTGSISVLHVARLTTTTYLLHTLESSFGIQENVSDWFQTYLTGRTQTAHISECTSEPHDLKYGVPQGSVRGPMLFTIYTTPLGKLIRCHILTFHLYADDTQLYVAAKPSEPSFHW